MELRKVIASLALASIFSGCGTMMSHHKAMGDSDKMFVMEAAMGSNAEVATSQLALERSKNSDVREFATQMVADHKAANAKLEPIAMAQGLTLPTSPDPTHVAMTDHLAKLPDNKFDGEYVASMVADHAMVISKFEHASKNASDAAIRNFAAMQLPALKHHYQMVQMLEQKFSK